MGLKPNNVEVPLIQSCTLGGVLPAHKESSLIGVRLHVSLKVELSTLDSVAFGVLSARPLQHARSLREWALGVYKR